MNCAVWLAGSAASLMFQRDWPFCEDRRHERTRAMQQLSPDNIGLLNDVEWGSQLFVLVCLFVSLTLSRSRRSKFSIL